MSSQTSPTRPNQPNHFSAVLLLFILILTQPTLAQNLNNLQIMNGDYPQAFFFRSAEGMATQGGPYNLYDEWDQIFSRLSGIIGKVLDEEVPGRSKWNPTYFNRFKQNHPDQLVLLHYNGNARDPRYQMQSYFPGHFIYYNGTSITQDIPAQAGITEIHVDNPKLFATNIGRYKDKNDDIGLCELDANNKPNWHHSEQVQLISVDHQRSTIKVQRGAYGSTPRAFKAKRAYAAAHATEGPWGSKSNLMWFYNYSTQSPVDQNGQRCAQVHARELAHRFAPGQQLATFNGLEFDVLAHSRSGSGGIPGRGLDTNADGKIDNGRINNINTYGQGVLQFLTALRQHLGEQKFILADGHTTHHQRAAGILNGIESEGWPDLRDPELADYSGGINRHNFWRANARPPAFSFINHKFVAPTEVPGEKYTVPIPMSRHRLVFAAGVLTDSAICYAYTPRPEPGEQIGIWDELHMGKEHRVGWLGKPLGPTQQLATQHPNLFKQDPQTDWRDRIKGDNIRMTKTASGVKIHAINLPKNAPPDAPTHFTIQNIPTQTPNLTVTLNAHADPMPPYPSAMPRLMYVGINSPDQLASEFNPTGMRQRNAKEAPIDTATGALMRYEQSISLSGESYPGYRIHPPYRNGVGMVYWQRDVTIPRNAQLSFLTAMSERAPGRSDGVLFKVQIDTPKPNTPPQFKTIFEHNQIASEWMPHTLPLDQYANQRLTLRFVADAGPNDNSTTDQGMWGAPRITSRTNPRAPSNQAPSGRRQFMTWANSKPFDSTFAFNSIQSESVDLTFQIEGHQPLYLNNLTAHAAPDGAYRLFQHGLVIANPSNQPATFHLNKIAPNQKFRRLLGSSQQDPTTNNGAPAQNKIKLAAKDALFLIRDTP